MAKLDDLLAGGQGKLGKLVFYRMNGKNYVRTRPDHFTDRKSPAQLAQRQRLQVTNEFLRPFREIVRVTFAAEAEGRSALQAAQSYNMRQALAGEYPGIYIDKSKSLLSRGPLPLPQQASVVMHPEGLLIEWINGEEAEGRAASDTLVVLAFSGNTGRSDYKLTDVRRTEGRFFWKTALPLTEEAQPDVWMAFRNETLKQMSDSRYLNQ